MLKKVLFAFLIGFLAYPVNMDAKLYKVKNPEINPNLPPRAPALNLIAVNVDASTGELTVYSNYNVYNMTITLSQGSTVFEETTVSLAAGQVYTTSVASLEVGNYTLSFSNINGGLVQQYTIIVEDD